MRYTFEVNMCSVSVDIGNPILNTNAIMTLMQCAHSIERACDNEQKHLLNVSFTDLRVYIVNVTIILLVFNFYMIYG